MRSTARCRLINLSERHASPKSCLTFAPVDPPAIRRFCSCLRSRYYFVPTHPSSGGQLINTVRRAATGGTIIDTLETIKFLGGGAVLGAIVTYFVTRSTERYKAQIRARERYLASFEAGTNELLRVWRSFLEVSEGMLKVPEDRPYDEDALNRLLAASRSSTEVIYHHRIYLAPLIPIGGSSRFVDTAIALSGYAELLLEDARRGEAGDNQGLRKALRRVPGLYVELTDAASQALIRADVRGSI